MNDVKVSVICNTYNHGPYIRSALNGFVMQKTNFKFEVLIHDDASTDDTAEIIREYESKYPELIKPIYQDENQYSKGVNITQMYHLPRLKGKYVALCEGDDYWTDPLKLQKQYDAMEGCPEVDICAHSANRVEAATGKVLGKIEASKNEKIIDVKDVILGGGGFVATNSLFYRKCLLEKQPEFRRVYPIDYTLQIQGALRGGMLYLPTIMSAYRVLVPGSWTSRMIDGEFNDSQQKKLNLMLDILNQETGEKFSDTIKVAKLETKFWNSELKKDYKEMRSKYMKPLYMAKPIGWRVKAYVKSYLLPIMDMFRY